VDLMQADARARVARLVLDLAGNLAPSTPADDGVRHGLTQVQLAQAAGVSRESLNRVLHDFAVRGWLELFSYGFVVLDAQALWQRAGCPQWLHPAVTQRRTA